MDLMSQMVIPPSTRVTGHIPPIFASSLEVD
jgi:hypothetical protein